MLPLYVVDKDLSYIGHRYAFLSFSSFLFSVCIYSPTWYGALVQSEKENNEK